MSKISNMIIGIEQKHDNGDSIEKIAQELNLDLAFVQQVIHDYENVLRDIEDYPDEF